MATTKPKKTAAKKSSTKSKAAEKSVKAEKTTKPVKVEAKKVEKKVIASEPTKTCECGFFAKKCDPSENVLTIFKSPKIWGALLGEAIGTMLLTIVMLTFGANYILYIMLAIIAIVMAVYTISGAHLNPIVTVGMMATRRISAIRGVLYIVAQVVGAWLALILLNALRSAGGDTAELPAMAEIAGDKFWIVAMVEIIGAMIIGFFFSRALQYKRSALTFAIVVAGGLVLALICGIWFSGNYLGLSDNYIMNPAMALMMQIFPTAGENVGEVLGGIGLALAAYVIFPMIAGVLGFFLSDASSKLSGEKLCDK